MLHAQCEPLVASSIANHSIVVGVGSGGVRRIEHIRAVDRRAGAGQKIHSANRIILDSQLSGSKYVLRTVSIDPAVRNRE